MESQFLHETGVNQEITWKPALCHYNYREEMQEISDDKAIGHIVWQI